jgi:GDP/GTP exchange factor required for growth at low temperature
MSAIPPPALLELDDPSCPDTPVAPSASQIPTIEAPELLPAVDQLEGPSLASTLKLPDPSGQFLSPVIPPKPEFSLADVLEPNGSGGFEALLGPEMGAVDITVAGIHLHYLARDNSVSSSSYQLMAVSSRLHQDQ